MSFDRILALVAVVEIKEGLPKPGRTRHVGLDHSDTRLVSRSSSSDRRKQYAPCPLGPPWMLITTGRLPAKRAARAQLIRQSPGRQIFKEDHGTAPGLLGVHRADALVHCVTTQSPDAAWTSPGERALLHVKYDFMRFAARADQADGAVGDARSRSASGLAVECAQLMFAPRTLRRV